jgi:predicted AlkP superfamily phosphohydrolase/phosphomutase
VEFKRVLRKVGLYRTVKRRLPNVLKRMVPPARHTVDRARSRATLHSARTSSVTINRDSYPPHSPQYERFRDELREKLLALRDPETGQQVIRAVFKREEIYSGDYADRLPDLYIEPVNGYLIRGELGDDVFNRFPIPKSAHRPQGIFIAGGPDIARGVRIEGLRLVDAAPTFLHLLDTAIPDDVDGRVVHEVFRPDSEPRQRSPRYVPAVPISTSTSAAVNEADEELVLETLRGLGYLE